MLCPKCYDIEGSFDVILPENPIDEDVHIYCRACLEEVGEFPVRYFKILQGEKEND